MSILKYLSNTNQDFLIHIAQECILYEITKRVKKSLLSPRNKYKLYQEMRKSLQEKKILDYVLKA